MLALKKKTKCEKKSIDNDFEFLVFYKRNETASDNMHNIDTYIDTLQIGKKSDITAIKYRNIFVEIS